VDVDDILRDALGADAAFRDGQQEAIADVVDGAGRLLLVQATGWGKSVVYFTATRLLRARGAGPTIVISPLLSLMRDQRRSAERFGLRTAHVDASADLDEIGALLAADAVDVIFTTPEQLARDRFADRVLGAAPAGAGLLVVDEAHCISDWGHDFRPEYRRITRAIATLGLDGPLIATTATANDRVVTDILEQLGDDLVVRRGPLARRSLRLQAIELASQAARLAWLADTIPTMPGSGIVYCLTVADCERVAGWLDRCGIAAAAYYGGLDEPRRVELESALRRDELKVLVATVALGMGFDKPDLGFVVHFQLPASIVAYYQQVGRAGRALDRAHAVLLTGREDRDIHEWFITAAFPRPDDVTAVLSLVAALGEATIDGIVARLDLSRTKVADILQHLDLDGHVERERGRYRATGRPYAPDTERMALVTARRRREFALMASLVEERGCLMRLVTAALDDPATAPCGVCANCAGPAFAATADPAREREALVYLRRAHLPLAPRKQTPATAEQGRRAIPPGERSEPGKVLCLWGDGGWGGAVAAGRAAGRSYDADLVEGLAALVAGWAPEPSPTWVTAMPSATAGDRVSDLAAALAALLDLPFVASIERRPGSPQQVDAGNATRRYLAAVAATGVRPDAVRGGPVLLVDDLVDSGWTMTVGGMLLRRAGSGPVHPVALARLTPRGES
jgi:ATP-dependent DNA helicase RecQ